MGRKPAGQGVRESVELYPVIVLRDWTEIEEVEGPMRLFYVT